MVIGIGSLVIFALIIAIIVLIVYNIQVQRKIQEYKNLEDRRNKLSVIQDFLSIAGAEESVDSKLQKINEIVIEKYNIKYSTLVVFDGAEYVIKASNVDKIHYETLANLHTEEIFQDSVSTATPKYITIDNENEKLPYQKSEMGRAKSAMFFPLYIDNIYIGYWIMESGKMHAFENLDTTVIEVVKENIISVLRTMSYQDTIENIDRIDKFTGLHSAEYLYGKAKYTIPCYNKCVMEEDGTEILFSDSPKNVLITPSFHGKNKVFFELFNADGELIYRSNPLSSGQTESFDKFKDCQSEITDYLETEAFTSGFTIAVKLMVEVMKTMEIPEL